MMAACPLTGATPMIRMPDALEANMQKAYDLGVLGTIVPTVDDVLEARDASRYAHFPPQGRRSQGGSQVWNAFLNPGETYRNSINDNVLAVVMIETPEGVDNAYQIAVDAGHRCRHSRQQRSHQLQRLCADRAISIRTCSRECAMRRTRRESTGATRDFSSPPATV